MNDDEPRSDRSTALTTALWVKVCGLTSADNARMVAAAGVDAIGLNFAPSSPRFIDYSLAAEIRRALPGHVEVVGVFVDASFDELLEAKNTVGLDSLQLHGRESPELLQSLTAAGIIAYKALRIGTAADVELAAKYGTDRILVDAKVKGSMGGSGKTFDWTLIRGLNEKRKMILAGGLNPGNVWEAVQAVRPFGVDTASGVETAPGLKSESAVRDFVEEARG